VRHELFSQRVNARQVQERLTVQKRELAEIPAGKIGPDIAGVAFDDVFVVENPFRRSGGRLFQAVCVRKIQTNLMEGLHRLPHPVQQLLVANGACETNTCVNSLKNRYGMTELKVKDAVSPMLFTADDFQLLVTPMVWTESKPVTADKEAGKQAAEEAPVEPVDQDVAAEDSTDTGDAAKGVVAEAESVVEKAVKKVKSAKTQNRKGKRGIKSDKAKAGKAKEPAYAR